MSDLRSLNDDELDKLGARVEAEKAKRRQAKARYAGKLYTIRVWQMGGEGRDSTITVDAFSALWPHVVQYIGGRTPGLRMWMDVHGTLTPSTTVYDLGWHLDDDDIDHDIFWSIDTKCDE